MVRPTLGVVGFREPSGMRPYVVKFHSLKDLSKRFRSRPLNPKLTHMPKDPIKTLKAPLLNWVR